MSATTITALFYENKENLSDKWEQYLAVYDAELRPWSGKTVALLEIGVQNGGSMQLWSKYFAGSSRLIGLDIDDRILNLTRPKNVELKVADASDPVQIETALGEATFDLIIDDGSHHSHDIVKSFELLFPRLNPGGRYFIEDLHCSYWEPYGGGLGRPGAAIEYLKQLVDVVNADHIESRDRLPLDVSDELLTELRRGVAKVTFYDSVAVIERYAFEKVRPFRRLLAGERGELVSPLELLEIEEPGHIFFTEPLARTLEDYLLRQRRDAVDAQLGLVGELEASRAETERVRAEASAERANFEVQIRELQLQYAREQAQHEQAQTELIELGEAGRRAAADALGELILSSQREARVINRLEDEVQQQKLRADIARDEAAAVPHLQNRINALERSTSYRLLRPVRVASQVAHRALSDDTPLKSAARSVMGGMRKLAAPATEASPIADSVCSAEQSTSEIELAQNIHNSAFYARWRPINVDLALGDQQMIDEHIATGDLPAVTIVLRVDTGERSVIDEAISALRAQRLTTWTAIVTIVGGLDSPEVRSAVGYHVRRDRRLALADGDSSGSISWGLSPVLVTSASTVLHEHAVYLFAEAASRGALVAYADAERRDSAHNHLLPVFKPEYSPIYQDTTGYIGDTILVANLSAEMTSMLDGCGPLNADAATVLRHLRPALTPRSVERIPFVAQTDTRPPHPTIDGSAFESTPTPTTSVSIIIPTRDRLELLQPCIESILALTAYPIELIEIIVVDNGSTEPATLTYLDALAHSRQATIIRDDGGFNYPRLNNRAAEAASGEVLVLLNNDTTIIDPRWLARMVTYAIRPGVGAVGGKLLYPDGSVQHGGVVLGVQGVAAHVNHQMFSDNLVYEHVADFTHEASAVTAACLAIRSDVYKTVGGLDERLAVAFNDIDLCCAALAQGLVNVYIGEALAFHHESKSRGYDVTPEQVATFHHEAWFARSKYPALYKNDAYYNPNWSLTRTHGLAQPSRAARPWRLAHRRSRPDRTILLLVDTAEQGSDICLVVDLQARHLASLGHRVIVGQPDSNLTMHSAQYEHATVNDEFQASEFAVACGADVVVMHSPPFYGVPRWIGDEQITIAFDHGARPLEWLDDPLHRLAAAADRRFGMSLADHRIVSSEAIRDASPFPDAHVLPLGDDLLGVWSKDAIPVRTSTRAGHGWSDQLVVLSVIADHDTDPSRTGAALFIAMATAFRAANPVLAEKVAFVMVSKAKNQPPAIPGDHAVTSFYGVGTAELAGMYTAADLYAATSPWSGLGFGYRQALSMGLPVVATDISGHHTSGVTTADALGEFLALIELAAHAQRATDIPDRESRGTPWREHLDNLAQRVMENSQ